VVRIEWFETKVFALRENLLRRLRKNPGDFPASRKIREVRRGHGLSEELGGQD
jgi:hypothetical protein